jgi:hypothetical protein
MHDTLSSTLLHLQIRLLLAARDRTARERRGDDGQATAEYALVLLGAAAIALLIVAWASKTNTVGRLLDAVFNQLLGRSGGPANPA